MQPATPGAAPRPSMALIIAITASGTLSLHIFLPALPAVASEFAASPATVQLTLTLYLIGLAFGQLFYGPLSDRFGRRPLLIGGLSLHLASSLLACFAPGIQALLAARVVQALGGCSGQVLGRAIVRDGGGDVMKKIAALSAAMAIAPATAPLIGGYVVSWFGWRAIFALLAAISGVLLIFALWVLPETNHNRTPLTGIRDMGRSFASLLKLRSFRGHAIGGALASNNIYAYLAAAPFLFIVLLQRPAHEVGVYIVILIGSVASGALVAGRLSGRVTPQRIAQAGCCFQLVGSATLLAFDLAGQLSVAALVAPMLVFAIGTGLVYPSATALALSVDDRRIGAAAALYGFMQMSCGALCSVALALWSSGSALPTATILVGTALAALLLLGYGGRAAGAAK